MKLKGQVHFPLDIFQVSVVSYQAVTTQSCTFSDSVKGKNSFKIPSHRLNSDFFVLKEKHFIK